MHHIRIREKRLLPQDGLILGNGDLLDTRLMYCIDPILADIKEFEEGIHSACTYYVRSYSCEMIF